MNAITRPAPSAVTALILCGGRGSRMGGIDKPLAQWRGEAMVTHVARALAPLAHTLLVSINRNDAAYEAALAPYNVHLVHDAQPDHAGPLAGIAAALPLVRTDYLLLCAGDTPTVTRALFERLLEALCGDATRNAAITHDGTNLQPLHSALRMAGTTRPDAHARDGNASVRGWLAELSALEIDCSDLRATLRSFDTPQALEEGPPP